MAWLTLLIDRAAGEGWPPDAVTQLTINSDQIAYVEVVVRVDPSMDSIYRIGLELASGKQLSLYDGPDILRAWALVEQLRDAGLPVSIDRPEFLGQLQGHKIRSVSPGPGEVARWEIHARTGDMRAVLIRPHDDAALGGPVWWYCTQPSGVSLEGWPQLHASLQEAVVSVVDQLTPEP